MDISIGHSSNNATEQHQKKDINNVEVSVKNQKKNKMNNFLLSKNEITRAKC